MVTPSRPPLDEIDLGLTRARVRQGLFGEPREPARVGRFIVERTVGFGGMGRVYVALDPHLRRRVALKLIHAELGRDGDTVGVRERLVREARALAQLSHPHVVAAYEVTRVVDDVVLAMEYVPGPDLRRWLQRKRTWPQVVEVLRQAARGLSAAHRAGLVHRDFKPENVVVGDDGRVRVLDFGLALDAMHGDVAATPRTDATPHAGSRASTGRVAGTLGYVAPEVLAGRRADPRADQYAFCVTLHEALHGARPEEPTRDPAVPPALDGIVARGLHRDPERRWRSMDDLALALERDPTRSRRRGRALLGVAVLSGAGLLGVRIQRARAERSCEVRARAVDEILGAGARSDIDKALHASGSPLAEATAPRVAERLEDYAARWKATRAATCRAALVEGVVDESRAARTTACLSRAREGLATLVGILQDADAQLVARAVHAATSLPAPEACRDAPKGAPAVEDRIGSDELRADLVRSDVLREAGRIGEAADLAAHALAEAQRLDRPVLALEAGRLLGAARMQGGDLDAAHTLLTDTFFDARALARDDLALDSAIALVGIDNALARLDEAEHWARTASTLLDRLGETSSSRHAMLLHNLGNMHERRGDLVAAEAAHRRALEMFRAQLGGEHHKVAASMLGLGNVLYARGDLPGARQWYEEARTLLVRVLGEEHPTTITCLENLGSVAQAEGHLDEAFDALVRARAARTRVLGSRDPQIVTTRINLGAVHLQRGELEEAERELTAARELAEDVLGPDHPQVADAWSNLAALAGMRGDFAGALERSRTALELREATSGPEAIELLAELGNLALAQLELGRTEDARTTLQRGLDLASRHGLAPGDSRRAPIERGLEAVADRERP